jgi:ATP-dependent DNA helicase RecQ
VAAVIPDGARAPIPPSGRPIREESAGDSSVVTLKILSCILRAHEQIGREKVAKILAGSKDASIDAFRKLSTFGILPELSIRSIVGVIDSLIEEGFIDPGDGFRPVVRVTPKGRQFLKDRRPTNAAAAPGELPRFSSES